MFNIRSNTQFENGIRGGTFQESFSFLRSGLRHQDFGNMKINLLARKMFWKIEVDEKKGKN